MSLLLPSVSEETLRCRGILIFVWQCLFLTGVQPSLPSTVKLHTGDAIFHLIDHRVTVCWIPSLRVEEGFSTLDAIPLEDPPSSSNGNHGNKHKTEGFITSTGRPIIYIYSESALLLPFCQDSNLKRDLMENNEKFQCQSRYQISPQDHVCGILYS